MDQLEKFEDIKGIIRSRKLKKDSQYNGQKKDKKRPNNYLLYCAILYYIFHAKR